MKFTFKINKPTARSFDSSVWHSIKLNGKTVGSIQNSPFKIRLMVIKTDKITDNNPNCLWKWIVLKNEFTTLNDAKTFLNDNIEQITTMFELSPLNEAYVHSYDHLNKKEVNEEGEGPDSGFGTLDSIDGMGAPTLTSRGVTGSGDVTSTTPKKKKKLLSFAKFKSK